MKVIPRFNAGRFILAAAFFAALSLGSNTPAHSLTYAPHPTYSYLVDLNSKTATLLGGYSTFPAAINDTGQVAGLYFFGPYSPSRAFIAGSDEMGIRDLGTLGRYFSGATGINNNGQVVGWSDTAEEEPTHHAFITGPNGAGMSDLGTLGGQYSLANGVNDIGQVVGVSDTEQGRRAFITGPNGMGMRDVGTLGGYSEAYSINDGGQMVGVSDTEQGRHAFITGPNGMGMTKLGSLGGTGTDSGALGINDGGQVVGWYRTTGGGAYGPTHAFITGFNGAGMRDLGTLGGISSFASGINDSGQAVGWSDTEHGHHAFITGPNGGGMIDLNSVVNVPNGGILTEATGINNAGQIIAVGIIPEPEIFALFLSGVALIGFVARGKKMRTTQTLV
jgi:probable HAF family extracellular repeat protein